jgi:hypothetical protein
MSEKSQLKNECAFLGTLSSVGQQVVRTNCNAVLTAPIQLQTPKPMQRSRDDSFFYRMAGKTSDVLLNESMETQRNAAMGATLLVS